VPCKPYFLRGIVVIMILSNGVRKINRFDEIFPSLDVLHDFFKLKHGISCELKPMSSENLTKISKIRVFTIYLWKANNK